MAPSNSSGAVCHAPGHFDAEFRDSRSRCLTGTHRISTVSPVKALRKFLQVDSPEIQVGQPRGHPSGRRSRNFLAFRNAFGIPVGQPDTRLGRHETRRTSDDRSGPSSGSLRVVGRSRLPRGSSQTALGDSAAGGGRNSRGSRNSLLRPDPMWLSVGGSVSVGTLF